MLNTLPPRDLQHEGHGWGRQESHVRNARSSLLCEPGEGAAAAATAAAAAATHSFVYAQAAHTRQVLIKVTERLTACSWAL